MRILLHSFSADVCSVELGTLIQVYKQDASPLNTMIVCLMAIECQFCSNIQSNFRSDFVPNFITFEA